MGLQRAGRVALSETVAGQLRQAIEDGEYPAGAKLPTEAGLSATLGVGRTTVREAVRALVSEGLLASRQGSGVYATGHIPLRRRLSTAALVEVFQARCAIETYAAELACTHRTDDDLAALTAALEYRDEAPTRTEEFARRDIGFHRTIVAASGNTILVDIFTALEPRLIDAFVEIRFLDRAGPAQIRTHVDAHHAIVDAIRARDIPRTTRLTKLLQEGAITLLKATDDTDRAPMSISGPTAAATMPDR